jgi:hypothetical protein
MGGIIPPFHGYGKAHPVEALDNGMLEYSAKMY